MSTEVKKGISVVIGTYNGATRLPRTLEHLSRQIVREGLPWEVIVVDNNSNDGTSTVAERCWDQLKRPAPLRVLSEPRQGATYAKETGIQSSRYETVILCDDDNWLATDYLQIACDAMNEHPHVGVIGGLGVPIADGPIPDWFDHFRIYYATGPQSKTAGKVPPEKNKVYGAGLVLRKSAFLESKQMLPRNLSPCRKGKKLLSGGDIELCYRIALAGYDIWYEPRLRFRHFMTEQRLNTQYLKRLAYGLGYSSGVILPMASKARKGYSEEATQHQRWLAIPRILLRLFKYWLVKIRTDIRQGSSLERNIKFHNRLAYHLSLIRNFGRIKKDLSWLEERLVEKGRTSF